MIIPITERQIIAAMAATIYAGSRGLDKPEAVYAAQDIWRLAEPRKVQPFAPPEDER
jgi:hypothetical protein